jgi:hypothetical protein
MSGSFAKGHRAIPKYTFTEKKRKTGSLLILLFLSYHAPAFVLLRALRPTRTEMFYSSCLFLSLPLLSALLLTISHRKAQTASKLRMTRVPMPNLATLLDPAKDKQLAFTPPPYSDVAQRLCDRKLLAQQTAAAEEWKKRKDRKIVATPWINKDGTPTKPRDQPLWKCPPSPLERRRSPAKTPQPQHAPASSPVADDDGGSRRQGNVEDEVRPLFESSKGDSSGLGVVAKIPAASEHDKAVALEVAERRRRRSAPNPILPSELLPELMPGVRRELLSAATKRARRANQRRKDALKLFKATQQGAARRGVEDTAKDVDMFDRPRSPPVTDAASTVSDPDAVSFEASPVCEGHDVFKGKPIVVTTVDPSAVDEGLLQYAIRHVEREEEEDDGSFTDDDKCSNGGERLAEDPETPCASGPLFVPPPITSPSPSFQKLQRKMNHPLRTRSLPETHSFMHEVRMKRHQQARWEPRNDALHHTVRDAPAPAMRLLPLGQLNRPDTASTRGGEARPSTMKMSLNLALLNARSVHTGAAERPPGADDDDEFVRSQDNEAHRRGPSATSFKLPPPADFDLRSNSSFAQELTRSRCRSGASGAPQSNDNEGNSPLMLRDIRRDDSRSCSPSMEKEDESFPRAPFGQRSLSPEDDEDDDDFLLETTLPKKRMSTVEIEQPRYNAKPFILPPKFMRYKGDKISTSVTGGAADVTTKSTPADASTVKLVWGSAPSDAQPSPAARAAEHMLVVEVVFKTRCHHFDAVHIRSLLGPHARDVIDMEAGNRGGFFIALYGSSRLQLLKAIACMMTKIHNGESYLFSQAFNAPRSNVESEMLLESPRQLEDLPPTEQLLPRRKNKTVDVVSATTDTWFARNSVVGKSVNLHAPGALEQFMVMQAKKKEQTRRRKQIASKIGASLFAAAAAAEEAVQKESSVLAVEQSLFIAEGDAVPLALVQMKEQAAADRREAEEKALKLLASSSANTTKIADAVPSTAPAEPSNALGAFGNAPSGIFDSSAGPAGGYLRLQAALASRIDKARGSIISLIENSDVSLEELRKARARQILEGSAAGGSATFGGAFGASATFASRPPRPIRRLSSRNLRRQRDEELRSSIDASATGLRRLSFHQMAAEFDMDPIGTAAATGASSPNRSDKDENSPSGSHSGWDAVKKKIKKRKTASTSVVLTEESGGEESASRLSGSENPPPAAEAVASPMELARLATVKAMEQFEAFIQAHCVYDKIAVIVPMTEFKDPAIAPTPMAEADAEDLTFLLQQLDYHVVVMVPPAEIPVPDEYDATPEEKEAYKQSVEQQQKEWFLVPTAENISKVVEAFVYRSHGTFQCNVALFMLTRGYIGTPDAVPNPSTRYAKNETQVALTFDSSLNKITRSSVLVASDLIAMCRQSTVGRQPMVFIDTYPVYENPNADAHILYEHQTYQEVHSNVVVGKGKQIGALSANSFLYFSATPEDGGDTLSCVYPRHVGGLGTYYLKRALEGRALPANQLRLTMSSMIYYMSAKLQVRQCRVAHNAQGLKAHSQQRPYFDFSVVYDSHGELRDAFHDSHEIELKGDVRINLQLQVKIDMGYYSAKELHFLPRSELWWRHLRRELHRLLYPKSLKNAAADDATGAKASGKGKAKQHKGDRVRFCCCVASNQSVSVEYLGLVDVILEDRKLRFMEKDFGKIADRCWAVQEEKETGYIFAGSPPPLPPIVLRPLSDFEKAASWSMRNILEKSRRSSSFFNPVMQEIRRLVPVEVEYPLSTGFVEVFISGQQRRKQQNFVIQYIHAGMGKQTAVGTTPVSLSRRPTGIYGTVLLSVFGTRRDARKMNRYLRQQPLRSSHGIIIERVELDPFEPHEHAAALKIQRRFRGHVVRRVLHAQRVMLEEEGEHRNDNFTDEDIEFEELLEAALKERHTILVKWEATDRSEIHWAEHDQRLYLLATAIKYLVQQQDRGRRRILIEEIVNLLPLAEGSVRATIEHEWIVAMERFAMLSHFGIGVLWDHFYLQSEFYQEILRFRNACREQAKGKIQFGFLMPRPEPPCTLMDLGYSIVRGLIEERAHSRKSSPTGRLRR